jgi:tetratricopeptide (TPR) repeat protein
MSSSLSSGTRAESSLSKTHIAIEYAHKYGEDHPDAKVLWVNARTAEQFEHSYKSIGNKLSIQSLRDPKTNVLHVVNRYLSQDAHGPWLMVLEGADDQDMFHKNLSDPSKQEKSSKQKRKTLLDYIPTCPSGIVLITSQSLTLAYEMVNQQMDGAIEITPLTREESISLLRKTLPEDVCDDQGAHELVEALHHSPIAINQATAYIHARGTEITIPDYLDLLKSQNLKLSTENSGDATGPGEVNNAESAAVRTWQILYEFLRQKYPEAARLLSVIGVLDLQSIPLFLLNKSNDARQVKTLISTLVQFGMVTYFANQKSVSATRMVQRCTQAWLAQRGEKTWAEERALWILKESLAEEYETCEILYPYVILVLGFQPTSVTSKLYRADILFNTAGYVKQLGKYDEARRYLEDCLKLREEGLGKEDDQIEETKKALEAVREAQSQTDSGTQPTKGSSGKQGTVSPSALLLSSKWPKALSKVQNILQLAQQSLDQEQHQEAEARSKEGLAECEKTLGEDHLDTLQMADCLAMVFQSQGRQAEALTTRTRVLNWCKAKYGPDHIDTIRQTYNYALIYDQQGQYDQAITLYLTALESSKKLLGPTNPLALRILSSLATIYDLQDHTDQAETTFRETLAAQTSLLGPEHPETLLTMHNLALCSQSRGDYATAEAYLLRVLAAQERILGPENSATLRTASNLGLNFALQGQMDKAEALYKLAVDGQTARFGEGHPDTLITRMMLGELFESTRRREEARAEYRVVLAEREKTLGVEHEETMRARRKLEGLGQRV